MLSSLTVSIVYFHGGAPESAERASVEGGERGGGASSFAQSTVRSASTAAATCPFRNSSVGTTSSRLARSNRPSLAVIVSSDRIGSPPPLLPSASAET